MVILKAQGYRMATAAAQGSKKPRGYRVSLVAPTGFESENADPEET